MPSQLIINWPGIPLPAAVSRVVVGCVCVSVCVCVWGGVGGKWWKGHGGGGAGSEVGTAGVRWGHEERITVKETLREGRGNGEGNGRKRPSAPVPNISVNPNIYVFVMNTFN